MEGFEDNICIRNDIACSFRFEDGGVKYGAGLKARGCCIVERFPCSTIEIGNYCAFTSSVGLILEELIINVLYRQDALELK